MKVQNKIHYAIYGQTAADEYKKYKAQTLSDVEEDYPRINIFLGCYTEM